MVNLKFIGQTTTQTRRSNAESTPALEALKSTPRTPFGLPNRHEDDLAGSGASHPFALCSWPRVAHVPFACTHVCSIGAWSRAWSVAARLDETEPATCHTDTHTHTQPACHYSSSHWV